MFQASLSRFAARISTAIFAAVFIAVFAGTLLTSAVSLATPSRCEVMFGPMPLSKRLAYEARDQWEFSKELNRKYGKRARGYALISAAMVGSGMLGMELSKELPKEMAFVAGQVSAIGIYMLGAPIWEPISSAFRKFAFGLGDKATPQNATPELEKQWSRTQSLYSVNGQMSRNVIQNFLIGARMTFTSAREAMVSGNRLLAIDQIAEIAVNLRRLFADIEPTNESIALAIQSSFTRHVPTSETFKNDVMRRIAEIDADLGDPLVADYYRALLKAWLEVPEKN